MRAFDPDMWFQVSARHRLVRKSMRYKRDYKRGWGHIDTMIDNFLAPIAAACREHPNWIVSVSR